MKISKTAVLAMGCVFATAGLGLMVATVVAGDESDKKDLLVDLSNAIQHIEKVTFISSGTDTSRAIAQQVGGSDRLVGIKTNRFVLSESEKSNIIKNGKGLSILGGKGNTINSGAYNIILAGSGNKTEQGRYNTILGGEGNRIGAKSNSTIIGGKENKVGGSNAVIVGGYNNEAKGDRSVVVGNDSHITGTNSTALGLNSKINAKSSFLWTDGKESDTLQASGVFAVVSQSGMVINTDKAHPLAQLTIGKPMIVYPSDKSKDIVCKDGKGGGIMKVMKNGESNQVCFCSCDGSGWNSLFEGRGSCLSVCKGNDYNPPKCGTEVKKLCIEGASNNTQFSGTCEVGEVLEGTGAYLVTSDNKVHWSCQTEDGSVNSSCSGEVNSVCEDYYPEYTCEPGRYLPANKRVCDPCLCGSYCEGGTFTKKSTDQGISPCGDGEFSEEKSSSCESCPEGKFPTSNHCGCMEKITCEAGTYLQANSIECKQCPCGSYCPGIQNAVPGNSDQGISPCGDGNFSAAGSSDSSSCKACNGTVSSDKCNCEEIPPQDPECGTNAKTRYFQNKNTSTIRWYDNENDCKFGEESSPSFVDETTKKDLKWTCREGIKYETCYAHQQWCGDGEINGGDEECDLGSNNGSTSACCNASCKLKESCASPSCKNSLKIIANGGKVIINDDSPVISQTTLEQACNSTVKLTFQKQSEYKTNCTTTFHGNGGSATSSAETTEITKTTSYPFSGWSNSSTTTCGTWAAPYYTYPANSGTTCTKTAQWKTIGTTSTSTGKITLPSAKRDRYTFLGWYTTTGTNAVRVGGAGDDYTPMACIPLYAHWRTSGGGEPCSNTLKINPNGGRITFNGTDTLSVTTATQECGSGIYVPDPSRTYTTTGNCTVNFDGNGGTATSPAKTTKITKTTSYPFSGWSNTGTCGTFAAHYYTYPANSNGTTCTKTAQWKAGNTITSTGKITLPYVGRDGYDFLGWYTATGTNGTRVGDEGGEYEPTACTTLYAHWQQVPPQQCSNTLKVDPNGGQITFNGTTTTSATTATRQCGSEIYVPDPSRTNTTTGNCEVDFDGDGGNVSASSRTTTITKTTKYNFDAWSNSSTDTCGTWNPSTKMYTYPANRNGTTCTKTAQWEEGISTTSTGEITLPTATRPGYDFLGWYTAKGPNGDLVGVAQGKYEPRACITLYAHWKEIPPTPCENTLKVNPNGGKVSLDGTPINGGSFGSTTKQCGSTSNIDTSSYIVTGTENCYVTFRKNDGTEASERMNAIITTTTGYYFNNWTNSSNCGKWEAPHYTHPATSGTICTKTANWGTIRTISTGKIIPTAPTNSDDYKFLGWYDAASGGNLVIPISATEYNPTQCNINLYAHWRQIDNGQCYEDKVRGCMNNSNSVINTGTYMTDGKITGIHWQCQGTDGTSDVCEINCKAGETLSRDDTTHDYTCTSVSKECQIDDLGEFPPLPARDSTKYLWNDMVLTDMDQDEYRRDYATPDQWSRYGYQSSCMWTCKEGYHINDDMTECVPSPSYVSLCNDTVEKNQSHRYQNIDVRGYGTTAFVWGNLCQNGGSVVPGSLELGGYNDCVGPRIKRSCEAGNEIQECDHKLNAVKLEFSYERTSTSSSSMLNNSIGGIVGKIKVKMSPPISTVMDTRFTSVRITYTNGYTCDVYVPNYTPVRKTSTDSTTALYDGEAVYDIFNESDARFCDRSQAEYGVGSSGDPSIRCLVCDEKNANGGDIMTDYDASDVKKVEIMSNSLETLPSNKYLDNSYDTVFIGNYLYPYFFPSGEASCGDNIRQLYPYPY